MMRNNQLTNYEMLDAFFDVSRTLKINVFTSTSCTFCAEAVVAARKAASKFQNFDIPVEVVETSVEERPDIVEALSIIAVPMILVGNSKIVGLPHAEDIELLLHQTMLGG
ncbi:MAG: thioredoxin family protein [Promethearchaeota archaeon]